MTHAPEQRYWALDADEDDEGMLERDWLAAHIAFLDFEEGLGLLGLQRRDVREAMKIRLAYLLSLPLPASNR